MADFCKECSINLFGEDFGDLAGLGEGTPLPKGYIWTTWCDGCGPILVDDDGLKVARNITPETNKPRLMSRLIRGPHTVNLTG